MKVQVSHNYTLASALLRDDCFTYRSNCGYLKQGNWDSLHTMSVYCIVYICYTCVCLCASTVNRSESGPGATALCIQIHACLRPELSVWTANLFRSEAEKFPDPFCNLTIVYTAATSNDTLSLFFLFAWHTAVGQHYETRVHDAFVIVGNDALVGCSLPSFAAEFLAVTSWTTSEGESMRPGGGRNGNERGRGRIVLASSSDARC